MKRNSNLRIQTFHPKKCRCIQPNFFSHHLNLFPMPDFMGSHKMTWRIFMSKSTKLSVQIIRAEDNTDNVWGNWKWSKEISTSISESFTMRHIIHLDTRLDNISIIIFNLVLTWVSLIWLLRNEIVSGAPWWLADWMFSRWRSLDMVMIFLRLLYLCDLLVNCYSFYQNYLSIHNNRV